MTSLSIIDAIEVATPCPADWSEMLGDDKVRFCGSCEKNVYNFAAMTRPEIVELIEQTEGVFCGRLYRRADGTVLTADCPVGLADKARRAARRAARRSLAIAGLLTVSLAGGALGFFSKSAKQACKDLGPRINSWSQMDVAGGIEIDSVEMGEPAEINLDPPKPVVNEPAVMGGMRMPERPAPQPRTPPQKLGKVRVSR